MLENLENITIIGHRNPVVKCNDVGAVKFISCKNVTIEGIQWEGCGSKNYPGIEFFCSYDVSFKSCSFYNSKRSILFSDVSGDVLINCCNFTQTNEYCGHGAAIHYRPNTNSHVQHKVVIQNSHFIFNKASQSIVYIAGPSGSRITSQVYLQDNTFVNNTGVPLYVTRTNLTIKGTLLFKGNAVKSGGGIYSENCNIIFYDKSNVNFISNSARVYGGAIFLVKSRTIFGAHSTVTFNDNNACNDGGAVYSNYSNITSSGTSTFNNNQASDDGGAIYCGFSSHLMVTQV